MFIRFLYDLFTGFLSIGLFRRVKGNFPSFSENSEFVEVSEPTFCLDPKNGIHSCGPNNIKGATGSFSVIAA
jgi:hypothetical protein